MHVEPANFDREALVSTLRGWELKVTSLSYLPVGFGSHHYPAVDSGGRRWFVTVDELLLKLFGNMGPTFQPWVEIDLDAAYEALDRAFRTAAALREAGLEFVLAPITRPDAEVLARLGDYAVSVLPFIDGLSDAGSRQPPTGRIAWHGSDTRRRLFEMLGRLHAATDAVAPGLPQRDSLTVPLRPGFLESLDDLRSPWTSGPYGEPARRLLQETAGAIRDVFGRCDELADAVRATNNTPWVVTHGQITDANVVRTQDGLLLFVDWECAAIGPRERDLATWDNDLEPKTDDDRSAYASAGESHDIDSAVVELYRHINCLWAVCEHTADLRSPHVDDTDTRARWAGFQNVVAEVAQLAG